MSKFLDMGKIYDESTHFISYYCYCPVYVSTRVSMDFTISRCPVHMHPQSHTVLQASICLAYVTKITLSQLFSYTLYRIYRGCKKYVNKTKDDKPISSIIYTLPSFSICSL